MMFRGKRSACAARRDSRFCGISSYTRCQHGFHANHDAPQSVYGKALYPRFEIPRVATAGAPGLGADS